MVRLDTAANRFGIEYIVKCGEEVDEDDPNPNKNDCVLDIVTVTDHLTGPEEKVQVFISGAMRGDARVGPSVAYYLIEYLASNFNKNPRVTYLLQHREIVITPMTNAPGFYANEEAEETRIWMDELNQRSRGVWRTTNEDFPYDNSECMNTVTGRVLYRLFVENLFVTAISFDGDLNGIAYPYADDDFEIFYNNTLRAAESPDLIAFDQVGRAMSSAAGSDI